MNDRCGGCNVGENKWLGVYGLTLEYVQDVYISNKISIFYNEKRYQLEFQIIYYTRIYIGYLFLELDEIYSS